MNKLIFPKVHDCMDITYLVQGHLHPADVLGSGQHASAKYLASGFAPRPPEVTRLEAQAHPRGRGFEVPANLRAIAQFLEHPHCAIAGTSALALYGVPYLVNSCDTTLNSPTYKREGTGVIVRRRETRTPWNVTWRGMGLPASEPHDAVAEALQDIRAGFHMWPKPRWITDGPTYWAVMLIDAACHRLSLSPAQLLKASHYRVNKRWMTQAVRLSSPLAESPKETEMRLMCMAVLGHLPLAFRPQWDYIVDALAPLKLQLVEQMPVTLDNQLVTVFDLAIPELRIALMYDGEHHLARSQRDKDFDINLECQLQGWTVLRFSAGTLRKLPWILFRAVQAAGRVV